MYVASMLHINEWFIDTAINPALLLQLQFPCTIVKCLATIFSYN